MKHIQEYLNATLQEREEGFFNYLLTQTSRVENTCKKYLGACIRSKAIDQVVAMKSGCKSLLELVDSILIDEVLKEVRGLPIDKKGNRLYSCAIKAYLMFINYLISNSPGYALAVVSAPAVVRLSTVYNPGDPNFKPASTYINSTIPSQLEIDILELIVNFRLPLVTAEVCFADIMEDLEVEFSPEEKSRDQLLDAALLQKKLDELNEEIAALKAEIKKLEEKGYDPKLQGLYVLLDHLYSSPHKIESLLATSGDKVEVHVPLLGEFIPGSKPKVVIYYENIQKSIRGLCVDRWMVMSGVFVHEMFHAWNYFCAGENARSVLAIDEPMVEFEALYFLNKLKDYTKEQSHYLKDKVSEVYRDRTHRVQQKQKSIGNVAAYGFGYYLHENLSDADAINWIETYSGKSAFINDPDSLVEKALIPVYPFRSEDKVLELFKQIVFNAHVTSVTAGKSVAAKPASPVSSEVTPESSHTDTRKIKVKGFDDTRMERLEAEINEFLNENDVEVVDIKFSSAAELSNGRSHSRFAALLLYRER